MLFSGEAPDTLTIALSSPISGVGFQMQQNFFPVLRERSTRTIVQVRCWALSRRVYLERRQQFSDLLGLLNASGASISHITISDSGNPSDGFLINQLSLFDSTNSVPEPATLLLLSVGILALAWLRRRQKKALN